MGVYQDVPGFMAGERVAISVAYRTANFAGGMQLLVGVHYYDSGGVFLSESDFLLPTSASYTRGNSVVTTPASCALIRVIPVLFPGGSGSLGAVWYREAMVERAPAASASFIDNPGILSYLVEPTKAIAESETDGTRRLRFKLRNASTAYDGY
jgi:hypothetical protein